MQASGELGVASSGSGQVGLRVGLGFRVRVGVSEREGCNRLRKRRSEQASLNPTIQTLDVNPTSTPPGTSLNIPIPKPIV